MAQINFEDITLAFGNNTIIENFNLKINEGEIVTFFGPSGCGKSSLMKLVLGINTPTKGHLRIDDTDEFHYKHSISYVPQDNELLPWLSVKDNIELWAKNSSKTNYDLQKMLELVELQNHSNKLPEVLSGGMARRTALARGLIVQSNILCFDEAMVGIEKAMRYKLLSNLRDYIKSNNATAIFISHDYEETIFLSDRIIIFSPPPTIVSKIIDVNVIGNNAERDSSFLSSDVFKGIYNQMFTI